MVSDAQTHADEDKKRRQESEARNRLDGLVYSTEKTFNENREKLDSSEASSFESAIADAKKALESNDAATMTEAAQRVEQASHRLAEAIYKGTASASSAGGGGGPAPGDAQQSPKEDEVIDTEYVDTEKD
jgi:molecular chaperone DnaK